jgi:hypothetical protein
MLINFVSDATVSASAKAQLTAVANLFDNFFTDPIKININVTFGALPATALAQSTANYLPASIAYNGTTDSGSPGILQRLIDDRTTADDKTAIDNLPVSDTHTFKLTRANGKALGIIVSDSATDGSITFNNASNFDYTHAGTGGNLADATAYDFFGVAAHEVSEIMGRVSFIVTGGQFNSYVQPLDLFKRDGSNNLSFDGAVASTFSIDGGTTDLLTFNNLTNPASPPGSPFVTPNGDFADWADSVPADDPYRARSNPGKIASISDADMRIMDVIGYDKKATDLVLAIDTTGSMGPYIDDVKAKATQIANEVFGPAGARNSIDARIAIVGFKDAAGPNGPGENTAILKFTEQTSFADRKTAAVNAINGITVSGGGDTPEGDNSALLFALRDQGLSSSNPLPAGKPDEYKTSGNFRKNADHKIIIFTDAPIKDVNLASEVATWVKKLNASVTPGGTGAAGPASFSALNFVSDSVAYADVAFTTAAAEDEGGDLATPGPDLGGSPADTPVTARLFVVQVGTDSSATASLEALADDTDGTYLTADATNLADKILQIINAPATSSVRGDFNADSHSDILWRDARGRVAVWQMDGALLEDSSFVEDGGTRVRVQPSWTVSGSGDLNGDGKADIVWRHDNGEVGVWEMDGPHLLSASLLMQGTTPLNPGNPWKIDGVADLNGDGKADLIWRGPGGDVGVWLMDGEQVQSSSLVSQGGVPIAPGNSWSILATADFNGDGKADLLWRGSGGEGAIWTMDGTELLSSDLIMQGAAPAPSSNPFKVAGTGDFTGDGKADILWRGPSGEVGLWEMDDSNLVASGLISQGGHVVNPGNAWMIEGTGDYTGDGKADILWRGPSGAAAIWTLNNTELVDSQLITDGTSNTLSLGKEWQIQSTT